MDSPSFNEDELTPVRQALWVRVRDVAWRVVRDPAGISLILAVLLLLCVMTEAKQ